MTNPSRDDRPDRLRASARWGMVVLASVLTTLLLVARRLEPDPSGFGTHTQLGLPPCHFASVTGVPCPTCGMTTAFAWFTRGRLSQALGANPAGGLLAAVSVGLIPWLLHGATTGRTLGFRSPETLLIGLMVAVVALSLLSWLVRLYF